MRTFIYKTWHVTVIGQEYYIEGITSGTKELLHFEDDLACIRYLNRRQA